MNGVYDIMSVEMTQGEELLFCFRKWHKALHFSIFLFFILKNENNNNNNTAIVVPTNNSG